MVVITAMHEIAHTVGIGTSNLYKNLIVNGIYTGTAATLKLKEVTGDPDAVLHGDAQHFWPYGLNYASEVESANDLIIHCKIVDAMQRDFYPTSVSMPEPYVDKTNPVSFHINSDNSFSWFTPYPMQTGLEIFSLSGKKMAGFDLNSPGEKMIKLDTRSLPHGQYICRFKADKFLLNRALVK